MRVSDRISNAYNASGAMELRINNLIISFKDEVINPQYISDSNCLRDHFVLISEMNNYRSQSRPLNDDRLFPLEELA